MARGVILDDEYVIAVAELLEDATSLVTGRLATELICDLNPPLVTK